MPPSARDDSSELGDYFGVLRRRWWVVMIVACLGAVAAAGYVIKAPKTYTATATVYATPNASNANQQGGRTGTAVNMDNEAQVVQSDKVAVPAARAMHITMTADALVKHISVTVPANTTVLQISCAQPSARGAAACAEAFASAYLGAREAAAKNKIGFEVNQLRSHQDLLQTRTIKLQRLLHRIPAGAPQRPGLRAQLADTKSQLRVLRSGISSLSASVNYNPGYILTAATPPQAPSSPRALLDIPSGLVAGLLLGLVAAFVIDRRDTRIHGASDVERFFDLPVLFRLPEKRLPAQDSLAQPRTHVGRMFTELAEAVGAGLGEGNHVLMVAASSPGQGGSVVAANLAAALARIRSDVLLVCADPADADTARLAGVGEGRGLAELMAGTALPEQAARRSPETARLRVITIGLGSAGIVNHLDHDKCRRLVTKLRKDSRYVVVAGQAGGEGADTFSLAEFADAALVVTEIGATTKAEALECIGRLDRMRTPILGAAVMPAIRRPRRRAASTGKVPQPVSVRSKPEPLTPGFPPPRPAKQPPVKPPTVKQPPRVTPAEQRPHAPPPPPKPPRSDQPAPPRISETLPLPRVSAPAPKEYGNGVIPGTKGSAGEPARDG